MKLSLHVLHDALAEQHRVSDYPRIGAALTFSRPFLLGSSILPGELYVASEADLRISEPLTNTAVICVGEKIPDNWAKSNTSVMLITGNLKVEDVFNQIQKIFDYYDDWNHRISEELTKDYEFDICALLKMGCEVLQNTVGVTDHSLQVIFETVRSVLPNGSTQICVNACPRPIPMEFRERVKEVCARERQIRIPYLSSLQGAGHQTYCQNLYPVEHFTGCVYVSDDHRPFRKGDFYLANHFFSYFQIGFRKYLRNYTQSESEKVCALRNLLNHTPLTAEQMEIMKLKNQDAMVCFILSEQSGRNCMPLDYMNATINALMSNVVIATEHDGKIVGLLRLGSSKEERSTTTDLFQELLRRMEYIGCISKAFSDISRFHEHFLQASYVSENCLTANSAQTIHFRDHVMQFILDECTQRIPAESLYRNGLRSMMEYDRHRNTEYVKTLHVFLKNEMSYTQTAEELYIHRSSLLKRLERIRHFISDDLDDPEKRLYYRICLALWERKNPME